MAFQCFDNPKAIFEKDFCVGAISKDMKGDLKLTSSKQRRCQDPECQTLRTQHVLKVKVINNQPCDSPAAKHLQGALTANLTTALDTDGMHRGFHSGDFTWTGVGGLTITGTMSGITNDGTHRVPIKACQKCGDRGIMEGKLCGEVVKPGDTKLKGCQVIAAYRIKFDPSVGFISTAVVGTIEGVLVCFCQA